MPKLRQRSFVLAQQVVVLQIDGMNGIFSDAVFINLLWTILSFQLRSNSRHPILDQMSCLSDKTVLTFISSAHRCLYTSGTEWENIF